MGVSPKATGMDPPQLWQAFSLAMVLRCRSYSCISELVCRDREEACPSLDDGLLCSVLGHDTLRIFFLREISPCRDSEGEKGLALAAWQDHVCRPALHDDHSRAEAHAICGDFHSQVHSVH